MTETTESETTDWGGGATVANTSHYFIGQLCHFVNDSCTVFVNSHFTQRPLVSAVHETLDHSSICNDGKMPSKGPKQWRVK